MKKPFFSEYDEKACWINELKPAFGDEAFFFERDTFESLELDDCIDETGELSYAMALN